MAEIDIDGSGYLDFAEYVLLMLPLPRKSSGNKRGATCAAREQAAYFADQILRMHNRVFGRPLTCLSPDEIKSECDEGKPIRWTNKEQELLFENLHLGLKMSVFESHEEHTIRACCTGVRVMRTPSGVAITKEDDAATFCALVLCGNLDVWVRNGSGEQSGVWGVLYRSMQALSPMLEHAYRILPMLQ